MVTKKLVIDGDHYTLTVFKEEDGEFRIEIMHDIRMKTYRMYPDNKYNLDDFK